MTLWHLLHSFSFTIPFAVALLVGIKTGNTGGIIVALVIGLSLALGSFYRLYVAGYHVHQLYEKANSKVKQNLFIGLLYFGPLVWSLLAGVIANYLTRFVISHLIKQ